MKKLKTKPGDFPSCPAVKTLHSKVESASSIPTQRAKISYASWSKNQNVKKKKKNRNNVVTISIKTLKKMIHRKNTSHKHINTIHNHIYINI